MIRRRSILRSIGVLLAVAVVFVGAALGILVPPGTPAHSRYVHFDGYIKLAGGHFLNMFDYITYWNHSLMVTSPSSGSVFRVRIGNDSKDKPRVSRLEGPPAPHGVAIATSTGMAFVSRSGVDRVDMFDPHSMQRMSTLKVANDADGVIYDPAADLIYVDNGDAHLATLIDPHGPKVVATIPLGGDPEFAAYDAKTGLIFQNINSRNQLVAVNPVERKVVGRWSIAPCEGPTGLALDARDRRLFAVCGSNAMMVVFDITTHKVVAHVRIGAAPDSVAYDPKFHRIYTAGFGGRMDIIEQKSPDKYLKLDSVKTHYGAHTLAIDPQTHRIYVGYASLLVAPRLAVFTPTTP